MAAGKHNPMEWTEQHDVVMLRELLASDIFHFKKGSPDRGRIWEEIFQTLLAAETPKFTMKEKRAVRERWGLLKSKNEKKLRAEESASGIDVPELTELEMLVEELCEKEKSGLEASDKVKKEKEQAEEVRRKAMEKVGETKKRKKEQEGDEGISKRSRKKSSDVVEYLKEKAKCDMEVRQHELDLKKTDQEQQGNLLNFMYQQAQQQQAVQVQLMQQQQQLSQTILGLVQKLVDKK